MMSNQATPHWNRKRIRLSHDHYSTLGTVCSITITTLDRQPVFVNQEKARLVVSVLVAHAHKTGIPVYGYCLMPDHLHLVLGPSETTDIITFVGQFKNLAQRALWANGHHGIVWQKRFWDHFLRADEHVEQTVEYVLNNPVRKQLVSDWRDYPFSGSLVFDL